MNYISDFTATPSLTLPPARLVLEHRDRGEDQAPMPSKRAFPLRHALEAPLMHLKAWGETHTMKEFMQSTYFTLYCCEKYTGYHNVVLLDLDTDGATPNGIPTPTLPTSYFHAKIYVPVLSRCPFRHSSARPSPVLFSDTCYLSARRTARLHRNLHMDRAIACTSLSPFAVVMTIPYSAFTPHIRQ